MTREAMPADADVVYHGALTDVLPCPLLYLTSEDPRARDLIVPIVKRYGLPPLRVDGPEDAGTLVVQPARGDRWRVLIGPGNAITVTWPFERPLIYGGGMSTPGWCQAALEAGECWLLVGPPRTWEGSTVNINTMFGHVWKAGGALGIVRVARTPATPTGGLLAASLRPQRPA